MGFWNKKNIDKDNYCILQLEENVLGAHFAEKVWFIL